MFEVDDYDDYVQVQTESALRNMATQLSLRRRTRTASSSLRGQRRRDRRAAEARDPERLAKAGVEVMEARISHLAYAPEIASAMLRRQQANAIIAARQKIVEGAVGMVEMALGDCSAASASSSSTKSARRTMVSNLLVVLCADRDPQPIVNAGTLY